MAPNLLAKGLGDALVEVAVPVPPNPPGRLAGELAALPTLRRGLVWRAEPRVFC